MRHRSGSWHAPRRLAALVLLSAFTMATAGEVAAAHTCAHHDHAAAGAPAQAAHAATHERGGMRTSPGHEHAAMHADAGETDLAANHHAPSSEPDAPCTCVGACHGSAATPVPAMPDALRESTPAASGLSEAPAAAPPILLLFPHLLPFPNAPPLID